MDAALTSSTVLLTALRARALPGSAFTCEEVRTRGWESANFRGARHELSLRFEGETAWAAADALLGALGQGGIDMVGQMVADWRLAADDRGAGLVQLKIEAVTLRC